MTDIEELFGGKITSLPERIPGTDSDESHLFVSLFAKESLSKAFRQIAEYARPGVHLPDAGMILEPAAVPGSLSQRA